MTFLEWATASPWWTLLFLMIIVGAIKNMYKHTISVVFKRNRYDYDYVSLERENARLKEEIRDLKNAKVNTDWSAKRANQERWAREARDKAASDDPLNFDDIMRAKAATDRETNSNQRMSPEDMWQKIRAEYLKNMKAQHPDKVRARGGSRAEIDRATAITQKLNSDYELAKRRFGK